MKPLISIIIPTYNAESSIDICLKSIKNQTFRNFEAIIIDDGSIDNTIAIAKEAIEMDCRFEIIKQKNKGVSEARNKGINISQGDYIMFLDSDDWIEGNTLEILYKELKLNNSDYIIFGIIEDYWNGGILYKSKIDSINNKIEIEVSEMNKYFIYLFNSINLAAACNKLIKTSIVKENNLKFNTNMILYEDFEFNLRVLKKIKYLKVIPNILYHYNLKMDIVPLSKRKKINIGEDIHYLNSTLIDFIEYIKLENNKEVIIQYMSGLYNLCFSKVIEKNEDIKIKDRIEALKYIRQDRCYQYVYDEYTKVLRFNRIVKKLLEKSMYRTAYFFIRLKLG